jgi:hypothetical protein
MECQACGNALAVGARAIATILFVMALAILLVVLFYVHFVPLSVLWFWSDAEEPRRG